MKQIITTEKKPIKLWLNDMESGAMSQARNLANLDFVFKHIAIMPDAHQGYGMPIGGVMATCDVIVPNAVGVDIGCGICAVKTSLDHLEREAILQIFNGKNGHSGGIRARIPLGFDHHKNIQDESWMPDNRALVNRAGWFENTIVGKNYKKALKQVGTLGGGNHFIEIQKGSDNAVWLMIHSGSRNMGLQVATHYNKIAISLRDKFAFKVPKNWDLAFLPMDSDPGQAYLAEMEYCVEFALANRSLMMENVKACVQEICPGVEFDSMINIAHNYAAMESHFGRMVMVHRKGATRAFKDTIGIVPGSQGTSSFIVQGRGNQDSFKSCAHGAGRKMGRTQARKQLDLTEELAHLKNMGMVHSLKSKNDLDEAAGAYKQIHDVMENQADLVDILVELKPLGVIKA
ncbi:MAG: RtcB family protein [Pseudomonadota bacterium]